MHDGVLGQAEPKPTRLVAQLRHPPGGRDARIVLLAQFLDRIGSGVWGASAVLYFTFVADLDARHLGLMLGAGGLAGIAGSPLAGGLAGRYQVRWLLIGCHLLRCCALVLLLAFTDFVALLALVAAISVGDRAAKTLEMVLATRLAGPRRSTYQGLSRSASNAGYAIGAGLAAIGLACGTHDAYRVLVLLDAISFVVVAATVFRISEPASRVEARTGPSRTPTTPASSPWRDPAYLLFVLLDVPMNIDDSILNVGLPLWLVHRTTVPHSFVPAFLVLNTVGVVLMQMRVSARVDGPRRAGVAVAVNGLTVLLCCIVLAISSGAATQTAAVAMLAAALLVTSAELMRSVSSWELAVSLAPQPAHPSYLGVAGMSQSVQKSLGPVLLTGTVLTAGASGWITLGAMVAAVSLLQWRTSLRRLSVLRGRRAHEPLAGSAQRLSDTPVSPDGASPCGVLGQHL